MRTLDASARLLHSENPLRVFRCVLFPRAEGSSYTTAIAETASFRQRYGEWALVTGASAGIGGEFARALATRRMSCVLTARREDRLRALARELEETCRVATRVVPADLAAPDGADRLANAVAASRSACSSTTPASDTRGASRSSRPTACAPWSR